MEKNTESMTDSLRSVITKSLVPFGNIADQNNKKALTITLKKDLNELMSKLKQTVRSMIQIKRN